MAGASPATTNYAVTPLDRQLVVAGLAPAIPTPSPAMPAPSPAIPATPPPVQPIGLSLEPEVAECAVRIGQHGVFTIFRALPHATKHDVLSQMERRERVVFLLLNGKRTLRHVAQLVHRSELDVARILVRLLKQGYIEHKSA